MELGRSWFLLVTVGLLGGAQAQVPLAELSDLQNKAVTLAAENLHSKTFVNKRFQIFSVLEAEQGDYSAGIFVRLNLLKKQTDCPKTQWEGRECRAVNNGRVFDCSVCAKYEYDSHALLTSFIDCVLSNHVNPVIYSDPKYLYCHILPFPVNKRLSVPVWES
ncbi:hypothetical protein XENTR_v10015675 [Xenopus tropicalis]|nr:hypothetical protein XENTR_v10015675 [Xenopus tropicalis]